MKSLIRPVALFVVLAIFAVIVRAEEKEKPAAQPDPAEIQKLMEAHMKVGKQHEEFKKMVGKWNTVSKSWHGGPDDPETSEGTATFKLIMGGRYLVQNFKGEYSGMKFEGMGISAYDNAKKKYVGTWMDNFGTGIMHTVGDYDEKTDTMVEIGTGSSPLGEMKMKMVSKHEGKDKFLFTMYMLSDEGEQKIMEMTYTRAKSAK